jgi:integrase
LNDQARVAEYLRNVLPRLGFGWVTTKTWRRTVATWLDEKGFTSRQIADQIGHEHPSLVQDVYMGRRVVSAAAAEALER